MVHVLYKSNKETQAQILCSERTFTIPCSPKGITSTLHFHSRNVQVHHVCSISCGKIETSFEIGGILKCSQSISNLVTQWINGKTMNFSEIEFPDFSHIIQVYAQWYKTLLLTLAILLVLTGVTYLTISSCGTQILSGITKILLHFFEASSGYSSVPAWHFFVFAAKGTMIITNFSNQLPTEILFRLPSIMETTKIRETPDKCNDIVTYGWRIDMSQYEHDLYSRIDHEDFADDIKALHKLL